MSEFARVAARVTPLDQAAMDEARARQLDLTKPPGSLGHLEAVGERLAGIAGECPPPVPEPAAVAVFAGDHGVVAEGVTPWPQDVTAQMVANFLAGGAAVNVLAAQVGASVSVVDVGVAGELGDSPGLLAANVRSGTRDLAEGPAMTEKEARAALDVGVEVANRLIDDGARCLLTGDMGIGNTTPSAALVAVFTGRPVVEVTGRGTGIDDAMLDVKVKVVERAMERLGSGREPLEVLAEVGGLEIAALAGFVTAGAAARVPVIVDGVVACAALLAASALVPGVEDHCIAGHRSVEPASSAALEHLGLRPLIDLDLRLGEGTGACLALPLVQAAARILGNMATFGEAGIG